MEMATLWIITELSLHVHKWLEFLIGLFSWQILQLQSIITCTDINKLVFAVIGVDV